MTFVRNSAGKELALYEGFTYFRQNRNKATDNWSCTRSGSGRDCKARITTSKDKQLQKVAGEHNHEPPRFIINTGVLIKY